MSARPTNTSCSSSLRRGQLVASPTVMRNRTHSKAKQRQLSVSQPRGSRSAATSASYSVASHASTRFPPYAAGTNKGSAGIANRDGPGAAVTEASEGPLACDDIANEPCLCAAKTEEVPQKWQEWHCQSLSSVCDTVTV